MPKTKYACEILGEYFATASALRARCREVLDKYLADGCAPEEEMSDDDAALFVELVRLRDPSRIPISTYVCRVVRCCRDGQIGRHVRFEYGDGTSDMIGWAKLCGGKTATFTQVTNAMRETIRKQVQAAYGAFFKGRDFGLCPKTGLQISYTGEHLGDRAVVHHDGMSFADIRDSWLRETGVRIQELELKDLWDGGGYEMADGVLRESWKKFHQENALLVVVSERWHKSHHANEEGSAMEKTA
jgi:hypothetical protein